MNTFNEERNAVLKIMTGILLIIAGVWLAKQDFYYLFASFFLWLGAFFCFRDPAKMGFKNGTNHRYTEKDMLDFAKGTFVMGAIIALVLFFVLDKKAPITETKAATTQNIPYTADNKLFAVTVEEFRTRFNDYCASKHLDLYGSKPNVFEGESMNSCTIKVTETILIDIDIDKQTNKIIYLDMRGRGDGTYMNAANIIVTMYACIEGLDKNADADDKNKIIGELAITRKNMELNNSLNKGTYNKTTYNNIRYQSFLFEDKGFSFTAEKL